MSRRKSILPPCWYLFNKDCKGVRKLIIPLCKLTGLEGMTYTNILASGKFDEGTFPGTSNAHDGNIDVFNMAENMLYLEFCM